MKYETHETTKQMARLAAQRPFSRALDLCCGSGWVALFLECQNPQAIVERTDIQPFEGATQGDLFENVDVGFDLIVCAAPCVPTAVVDAREDLRPRICYDGGSDGFQIIDRVIDACPYYLNPGGTIWIEFDDGQAGYFPDGWSIEKDECGCDRFAHWTKE